MDSTDAIYYRSSDETPTWRAWTKILTSGSTYVSNNRGYINGTQITYVSNAGDADTVDRIHAKDIIYGSPDKHGTISRPTSIDSLTKSGFYYTNNDCGTSNPFTTSGAKYGYLLDICYDDSTDY